MEKMDYVEMADCLEKTMVAMECARDLLAIVSAEMFSTDIGLMPYYKQFSAVIDCAFDKMHDQIPVVDRVTERLYELSREVKGV